MIKYLLILYIFLNSLNASTLKLTTNDWFPYTSSSKKGFINEIITEVFKINNIKYNIKYQNFKEGYIGTLNHNYDATFPYFKTNKRQKEVIYSNPIYKVDNVLFFNKNNVFPLEKNIYNHTIGLVKGYAYKNINKKKFHKIIYIDNELEAFELLNKGEIDLLPANKLVGIHIIKNYFNDFYTNIDFIKDKKFISSDFLYIIFNKTNIKALNDFNKGLEKIKSNGKYKEIILKNNNIINTNLSNVINLVNNTESFPMVIATEKINDKEKYIIPRGTKAVVLEWSKHFKQKGNLKIYNEMFKKTKVKIVNGPLKGKILYVENMYIEID